MLEAGKWNLDGDELVIQVAASATVIDMSVGADAKRLAVATGSAFLGRAMKLIVMAQAMPSSPAPIRPTSNGSRNRAERDPIVQRMQEKFGAEIRTIIDYRDKR
jgi:hypothetical protein